MKTDMTKAAISLKDVFTFDSTFNRKQSSESQNDSAGFDERFYDSFFSEKALTLHVHNCYKVVMSNQVKPGSHITVTGGRVPGRERLRYLRLVPGTAGRVQSCLRYRRYRTVKEKQSHGVFAEMEFFLVRFQNGCKKARNKTILANFFFFLVIEHSTKEEVKSNVNTTFGLVKYFDNVNKMDNSTVC